MRHPRPRVVRRHTYIRRGPNAVHVTIGGMSPSCPSPAGNKLCRVPPYMKDVRPPLLPTATIKYTPGTMQSHHTMVHHNTSNIENDVRPISLDVVGADCMHRTTTPTACLRVAAFIAYIFAARGKLWAHPAAIPTLSEVDCCARGVPIPERVVQSTTWYCTEIHPVGLGNEGYLTAAVGVCRPEYPHSVSHRNMALRTRYRKRAREFYLKYLKTLWFASRTSLPAPFVLRIFFNVSRSCQTGSGYSGQRKKW